MGKTLIRRRRRDTNEMPISITISRGRSFCFALPDGIPYDNEDTDRIEDLIWELKPRPDEVQGVVASGLGDLVSDTFVVTYWNDKRTDDDILLDIEDAIRSGLKNRAFLE